MSKQKYDAEEKKVTQSVPMLPFQRRRVSEEADSLHISFGEAVNRMIDYYYDNKETPEKLRAEAEKLAERARELLDRATMIEYGDSDADELARQLIRNFIDMKFKTQKKYRNRAIIQDVSVTDEYTKYLIAHVCNDKMPLGRAKMLYETVWHEYFDDKYGADRANQPLIVVGQNKIK